MALDHYILIWDDTSENDSLEFVVLPEGDYTFTVTNFERGRFPGSAKIPPCNKATLTISIDNDKGAATARFDLILYRTLEWKIASFFRCIGQKKHGEKVVMHCTTVVAARRKAHIKPRPHTTAGEERQVNDVDRFLDYDPSVAFTPVQDEELPWGNGGF